MEETMKCLQDTKTGNITRVSDLEAYQKAISEEVVEE